MPPHSKHSQGHHSSAHPKSRKGNEATRHSPTPSGSTLPTAHIYLKSPSSKPLIPDLQVVKDWCTADYKNIGSNGKNTISDNFFKSKLPEDLRGGSTEVELIWLKNEPSVYWVGKFQVDHHQYTDIKFGSDATLYIPEAPAIDEEINIDVPTVGETEATNDEAHILPPTSPTSPAIYIAFAIIILAWAHPEIAVTAIKILGLLGIFALLRPL